MSLIRNIRNYFHSGISGDVFGTFFRRAHKPTESRFKELFNSILFPREVEDRAKTTEAGHVKLVTSVKEISAGVLPAPPSDGFTYAPTVSQVTTMAAGDTNIGVTNDPAVTDRNHYVITFEGTVPKPFQILSGNNSVQITVEDTPSLTTYMLSVKNEVSITMNMYDAPYNKQYFYMCNRAQRLFAFNKFSDVTSDIYVRVNGGAPILIVFGSIVFDVVVPAGAELLFETTNNVGLIPETFTFLTQTL